MFTQILSKTGILTSFCVYWSIQAQQEDTKVQAFSLFVHTKLSQTVECLNWQDLKTHANDNLSWQCSTCPIGTVTVPSTSIILYTGTGPSGSPCCRAQVASTSQVTGSCLLSVTLWPYHCPREQTGYMGDVPFDAKQSTKEPTNHVSAKKLNRGKE